MNPRVLAATPLEDHALLLQFNNGEQRRLDVKPYLVYPVFARLQEAAFFALVRADHGRSNGPVA